MRRISMLITMIALLAGVRIPHDAGQKGSSGEVGQREEREDPEVTVQTPSTLQFDRIPIHFTLAASTPTTVNVTVSYSTNGAAGPFALATEALGSPSEGTSGLPASASGTPHVFVWNSFYDLEMRSNIQAAANVVVRITASNPNSNTSAMRMTNPFSVDNRVFTSIAGIPRTTPLGDGGPALAASLNDVDAITVGQDGTLYFDETFAGFYRAFKVGGTINWIAGNGDLGKGPLQTGPATETGLGFPQGVAIDNTAGLLFVSTFTRGLLAAVDLKSGIIFTVAGGGTGSDGLATSASFAAVAGLAVAQESNPVKGQKGVVFIADTLRSFRIRRLQYDYNPTTGAFTNAIVDTIAGVDGNSGQTVDGMPAKGNKLGSVSGLAYAARLGKLMFIDSSGARVRTIDFASPTSVPGNLGTIAGTFNSPGFSGDGGPATLAKINPGLGQLAFDPVTGNIYLSELKNHRVRTFKIGGLITTVAGNGNTHEGGLGGPAIQAGCPLPIGITVDSTGTVFIASQGSHRILRLKNGILDAVAGVGPSAADRPPTPAPLISGQMLWHVADDGSAYAADWIHNTISKFDPRTGLLTHFAGDGAADSSGSERPALKASVVTPLGLATDPAGNLYVSERRASVIRRIDARGIIHDFAGIKNTATDTGDGGPAIKATISNPSGLFFSKKSGALYVAEQNSNRIRMIDRNGIISTIAGNGSTAGPDQDGLLATECAVIRANQLWVDINTAPETVYYPENVAHRVRKFPVGGAVTTVAGTKNQAGYNGDGILATKALLNGPNGVVGHGGGNIYIGETGNHRIRRVDASGFINTVAGNGEQTFGPGPFVLGPNGSVPSHAVIDFPEQLQVDAQGNIYFSDWVAGQVFRFQDFGK